MQTWPTACYIIRPNPALIMCPLNICLHVFKYPCGPSHFSPNRTLYFVQLRFTVPSRDNCKWPVNSLALLRQVELIRRDFCANGGWETFLSYEDPEQDILIGLLRLRQCSDDTYRPELKGGCSIVRELHVYGSVVPVHARDPTKFQHQVRNYTTEIWNIYLDCVARFWVTKVMCVMPLMYCRFWQHTFNYYSRVLATHLDVCSIVLVGFGKTYTHTTYITLHGLAMHVRTHALTHTFSHAHTCAHTVCIL